MTSTASPAGPLTDPADIATFEAFADTIIPGEKRHPRDSAIAGVSAGGGAVAAGALEVLGHPALGFAEGLTGLAALLNGHAAAFAAERGQELDGSAPPFVALSFEDRTRLVDRLTDQSHPEQAVWFALALFATMAFDSAPHLSTPLALADGHPGLLHLGFAGPDSDGLWRFPEFSYRRRLADPHPSTTPTGSPA